MTGPRSIHVGHAPTDIEQTIADSALSRVLAEERRRDQQRAAQVAADRAEAQAAGWLPPDPPKPPPPRRPSKAASTQVPGRPRQAVPRPQPTTAPAGRRTTTTPSGLPVGSLVLSPAETTALDHLLAHPTVAKLIGQQRF